MCGSLASLNLTFFCKRAEQSTLSKPVQNRYLQPRVPSLTHSAFAERGGLRSLSQRIAEPRFTSCQRPLRAAGLALKWGAGFLHAPNLSFLSIHGCVDG